MAEVCKPLYMAEISASDKPNRKIREALKRSGMRQWQLAQLLGIGESTLVRNLRAELPEKVQADIIELINHARR